MHASDGAREVARELLGQIVQSLERILQMLDRPEVDAEALAGEVTTVFGNQRLFTDSVRDFYAYLSGILSRYDLGGEEYAAVVGCRSWMSRAPAARSGSAQAPASRWT